MTEPTEPSGASFNARLGRPDLRLGVILGAALLVIVGVGAAMGATPADSGAAPAASADPSGVPTASGQPDTSGNQAPQAPSGPRDDHGRRGFGPGPGAFGPGPGAFGPGAGGIDRPGFARGFRQITITAIDGSNVSLATDDGWHRTITVTETTRITKAGASITVGDLKVGDVIHFAEQRNADGSFTVTAIQVVVPRVGGTVTALKADGFTVRQRDGSSIDVVVTGSTTYRMAGAAASRKDVEVGSEVVVEGEKSADAVTASSVVVAAPRVVGAVTAKTATSITITKADGSTATIQVDANTSFVRPNGGQAGLDDIAVGSRIAAEGSLNADGSLKANRVLVGGQGRGERSGRPFGPGFGGGRRGFGPRQGGPDQQPAPTAPASPG